MEDLAAMQRVCRPWARMWLAERAVMAALPRCMVRTLHPPKALNLAKRHNRLQRKPLPKRHGKISTYGADERSAW